MRGPTYIYVFPGGHAVPVKTCRERAVMVRTSLLAVERNGVCRKRVQSISNRPIVSFLLCPFSRVKASLKPDRLMPPLFFREMRTGPPRIHSIAEITRQWIAPRILDRSLSPSFPLSTVRFFLHSLSFRSSWRKPWLLSLQSFFTFGLLFFVIRSLYHSLFFDFPLAMVTFQIFLQARIFNFTRLLGCRIVSSHVSFYDVISYVVWLLHDLRHRFSQRSSRGMQQLQFRASNLIWTQTSGTFN